MPLVLKENRVFMFFSYFEACMLTITEITFNGNKYIINKEYLLFLMIVNYN